VDGEELIFTNKRNAQQQLEQEYYDTSKVTLELLCIISFNNFKSLATLNTADTKKFLDQVLGFYTLTEYADICKQLRSDNQSQISLISNTIEKLESQVKKLEELSNMEVINGDIVSVKQEINSLMVLKDQLTNEFKQELSIVKDRQKDLNGKKITLVTLGKHKKEEIDFIEKGVCPTCGAKIDQSQLEVKKQEREVLLEQYNTIDKQCKEVLEELVKLDEKYNANVNEFNSKINESKILLTRLEEQAKRIKINTSEIEIIKQNIKGNEELLNKYQGEDVEWEQLYNILSVQVRSKILQSFIPALNKNILKYVQRLHLPYIVEFDSNFKCNISICGMDKDIPVSSLSTGQLKTVDMVIILGVLGTVIGSNGINILFLDELFSNLDAGLRNEMCSVLRESLKPESTIFIISHTDLEDKYFDGNIYMKLEVKDFVVNHSAPNADLMVADFVHQNQDKKEVELKFRHALSKVEFLFNTLKDSDATVYVQSLKVEKVLTKSTLTVTENTGTDKATKPILFAWATPTVEQTFVDDYDKTAAVPVDTEKLDANAELDVKALMLTETATNFCTWLVMPQPITNLQVKITYVIGKRQFESIFPLSATNITAWGANQYVRYTITLAPNKISFNPSVEDWDQFDAVEDVEGDSNTTGDQDITMQN
jgi:energy-coupling factor transporter ATP-binding protein EcfA2